MAPACYICSMGFPRPFQSQWTTSTKKHKILFSVLYKKWNFRDLKLELAALQLLNAGEPVLLIAPPPHAHLLLCLTTEGALLKKEKEILNQGESILYDDPLLTICLYTPAFSHLRESLLLCLPTESALLKKKRNSKSDPKRAK